MVYVFLANGFEEVEALVPVDILRRAGIKTQTVGVTGKTVTGSHGISVECDIEIKDAKTDNLEAVILPGGMPGTTNLDENDGVHKFIDYATEKNLVIAAICAAPSIIGKKGLLRSRDAVCFPGFEGALAGANIVPLKAVRSGNIITACGAGAAFEFGFLILNALTGNEQSAANMASAMKYTI